MVWKVSDWKGAWGELSWGASILGAGYMTVLTAEIHWAVQLWVEQFSIFMLYVDKIFTKKYIGKFKLQQLQSPPGYIRED